MKGQKKNKPHAVIYARVSTKEQEREGYSIPAQLKILREYAQQNHIIVLDEFTDSETGGKAGRTNFTKMIEYLSKASSGNSQCYAILVEKTDRLYRNFKDYVLLDELDLEIHLVKENQILSKDSRSNEKFIHGIKVLMAKNYIDNLSEEVKKGMREKAEQGMYPSRAPFGYINVRENDKSIIVPDPENARYVLEMFKMYSSGNYSLNDLKTYLQKQNVRLFKSSTNVNTSAIHKILKNDFYIGKFVWNNKVYIGTYEPIISKHLFDETQKALKMRGRSSSRKSKRTYVFQGFVKCGECGRLMVPDFKKDKYVYYFCKGGTSKQESCSNNDYVREEVFDGLFKKILNNLSFNDAIISLIVKALKESHVDEEKFHKARLEKLHTELSKIDKRLSLLYEDKLDGVISFEMYMQKREEYTNKKLELKAQIDESELANNNYIDQGVHLVELLGTTAELYSLGNVEQKRKIINLIGSNFSYENRKLGVQYRQPFDLIANMNVDIKTKNVANCNISDAFPLWWAQEESNL
ncbi:MAG: recombinase family protein [Candidatus Tenebribacter davisii]|nr:recombinase family protein [Candidatus Tenebribacter davisii]